MSDHNNVYQLRTPGHVLNQLEEWILSRHPRPGDQLATERELARSLGARRTQVQEALGILESAGVLQRRPNGAMVVAPDPATELDRLLRLHLCRSGFTRTDLLSIRIELECASATRAALEASPADLGRLRFLVDQMRHPEIGQAGFRELDCQFHIGLAIAAHNELATALLGALETNVKHEMSAGYANRTDWSSTAKRLAAEHHQIVDAIEQGDTSKAADNIAHHLTAFYEDKAG